jgi:hypothetical protein
LLNIIRKTRWADTNLISSILRILYYNVIKINRFEIFEYDLAQNISTTILDMNNYSARVIDYKELAHIIAGKTNLPREFYMHESDGVRHCVIVKVGDKMGHIVWIYFKGDKNRWFNLEDDEAHINYGFTFKEFRGQSLFPIALYAAAKWLKDRSYRRILMDVHEETRFMLSSMKKIRGVKHIGTLKQWFLYRPKYNQKKSSSQ